MVVATGSPTRATTLHWPLSEEQFAELCTLNRVLPATVGSVLFFYSPDVF